MQTGATFDTMAYDGLGRMISEAIAGEGSAHNLTVDDYYSAEGQLLEQRSGTADVHGVVPTIKQNV